MIYKINTIETWHQQKDKTKPHGLTSSFKKLLYTVKGQKSCCVDIFPYITLYVFIFPICLCQRSRSLFCYMDRQYMDRPGTCIILDKEYNIANSSCHFGSYGSIWIGPSPKINIFLATDRSIYCHMTLSAMNYLLYIFHIKQTIRYKIKHQYKQKHGLKSSFKNHYYSQGSKVLLR